MRLRRYRVLTGLAVFLMMTGWGFSQGGEMSGQHAMMQHRHEGHRQRSPEMMQRRKQILEKMDQSDQELMALLSQMEDAQNNNDKIAVMETILTKLVNTRVQMHTQLAEMMPDSMGSGTNGRMRMDQGNGGKNMQNGPMRTQSQSSPRSREWDKDVTNEDHCCDSVNGGCHWARSRSLSFFRRL